MSQYYVGIDLHKALAQVCVTDGQGHVVAERRVRLEDGDRGGALLEFLEEWREGGRYVVEAVGMNRWLVNACRKAGLDIVVADPVKLGLKTLGKKTDQRDAREMARRLRLGDIDRFAATYYPSDREFGARKLVRVRHGLVQVRQELANQVRGLLNAYFVRAPVSRLWLPRGLAWLRTCELPTEALTACVRALGAAIESLQEQVDDLSARIAALAEERKVRALVACLPNVAAQTAATIFYELGDVTRFRNARAAASYAGLVPRVSQSADTSHHGHLTKRGSRELRWTLSQWAVRLLATDPRAKAWARPRLRRMHKNKVRIALARRLLVGIYFMLTRGEVFSLERCLAP
jgi:transposase